MKLKFTLFWLFVFTIVSLPSVAQTTLSGGDLTGTLTKAGSPYTVTADLTVPRGQSLVIEPGVEMYFNQHIGMDVFGQITAQGSAADSIIFTASDTTLGWYGIRIRKKSTDIEEQVFSYCLFSYHFLIKHILLENHGVLELDSVNRVTIDHCLFTQNRSALGSGIWAWNSKVTLDDCLFTKNYALDTNKLISNAIEVSAAGSAAGFGGNCNVNMQNCIFEYNESYTPYFDLSDRNTKGGGYTFLSSGVSRIRNCIFRHNKAQNRAVFSSSGQQVEQTDSLIMTSCTFYQNEIQEGSILLLNGSSDNQYNAVITDCVFEENSGPDSANNTETLSYYNSFGGINEVTMERCTLLNNDNFLGIDLISSSRLYFNNGTIIGQNGFGFSIRKSVNCRVLNSIIANNFGGINVNFDSQLGVINSIVAFNGNEPIDEYKSSHGLYLGDRGRLDLINGIVTDNLGSTGRMANVVSTTRAYSPGYLHNSIVEGGIDSSYKVGQNWAIEEGAAEFLTVKNLITKPITFVKPPLGVGRAYASLDNDFHMVQDCDSTPTYDQGDFFNPPYPLNSWNDMDRDGNPRIQGKNMDIGPYELSGEKFTTTLQNPWTDTTLCDNDLAAFNPIVLGADIDYTWQRSTDNATWTDLPSNSYETSNLIDAQQGYYRLIAEQKECNVVDTFGATQLSVLAAPQPDLGDDKYIGNSDRVWLTPGVFPNYRWSIYANPRDTSHREVDASKYAADSKTIVWVEVTAANGCKARDSITIYMGTVGVYDKATRAILLYPNPATEYIKVDLDVSVPTELSIVNMVGQVVKSQPNIDGLTMIDIRDLPQGYYTLILSQKGAVYSSRFVKE